MLPIPITGFWCSVLCRKLPHEVVRRTMSRGKCRDSCGHGGADLESRELWGSRCYSFSVGRWDLRLSCRRGKLSRGIVLLHDNARPHTARQTQALLREQFHWDIFEHPPYSSDLVQSDFFQFPKMKSTLLINASQVMKCEEYCRRPHGVMRLYTNWCKVTTSAYVKGDYVEL